MNNTLIAADQDPNHSAHGHGAAAGLFMTFFVLGGLSLVARAARLCRRHHDPHATPYSHPTH